RDCRGWHETCSGRCSLGGPTVRAFGPFGAALRAQVATDAPAPVLLEPRVQTADLNEDRVRYGLLLLARRVLDALPADRLAVLDRHARELQALPVADVRGAEDRDRHHRRARLEHQAPDARLGLLGHFARARAPTLAVHGHAAAFAEDHLGRCERVLVARAAAHGKHAAVGVDELHRRLEQ